MGKALPSRISPTPLLKHINKDVCPSCYAWVRRDPEHTAAVEKAFDAFAKQAKSTSEYKKTKTEEAKTKAAAQQARVGEEEQKVQQGKKRQSLLAAMWAPKPKAPKAV